jgi:hypothetical protein
MKYSKFIDFPIEIYETIDEAANINFNLRDNELVELFDEAFSYVNNKLFNRYLGMFRSEEELRKIEKLICYIDFNIQ